MDINEIFQKVTEQEPGATFYKCDIHLHFLPEKIDEEGIKKHSKDLFDILLKHKINLIGLTVHREESLDHLFQGITFLKEFSKIYNYKIHIFPAIEIKDNRNSHLAIIFDGTKSRDDIVRFLGSIGKISTQNDPNNLDKCDQIDQDIISPSSNIKKRISEYHAIGFFPHPYSKNTGIMNTIGGESLQNFVEEPLTLLWNLGVPSESDLDRTQKDNSCPIDFSSTGIRFNSEKGFKKIARIKVSDSHKLEELDKIYTICPNCKLYSYCNKGYTYMKLSYPSITAIKQIGYDYRTRVLFDFNNKYDYPYLIGMYVKSIFFKEIFLKFNPELNVLIGGRGTGKSLLIDFIRFVCHSIPDNKVYFEIFHDKIRDQLGNGGKIVIFYKINNEKIIAIERTLILEENLKKINWNENTQTIYYEKNKNNPFISFESDITNEFFIEALSQTEIPSIHQKTKSLLTIIDAFIENFSEKFERDKKIKEYDKLKEKLLEKYKIYENFEKLKMSFDVLDQKLITKNQFLDTIKKLDLKKYQNILEINKKISLLSNEIDKWFKDIENLINLNINLEIFSSLKNDPELKIRKILDTQDLIEKNLNEFKRNILQIIISTKNKFTEDFNDLLKYWEDYYKLKYEEYKNFLKEQDIDYVEKVQNEIVSLNFEINSLNQQMNDLKNIKEQIIEKEKKVVLIAKDIYELTRKINSRRNKTMRNIQKTLKTYKVFITMHLKEVKRTREYRELLLKVHKTDLLDLIKKIQDDFKPFQLGSAIIENKLNDYSKNIDTKKRKIFDKLNELIENKEYPKIFGKKLFDLLKLYIDKKPIITFNREQVNRYIPLEQLSIGERCAVLLFIILLEKNKPLLIDQADAELDQESIKKLSKYLLKIKKKRQIIVATHNPNIPVLGDVDLLYHLDTKPSELREEGVILKRGGFEETIEDLLTLEGGRRAIIKRFKKYDWTITE